ncbi:unnamed protein product [Phytophthora fragariaefolia]|uniref:Unnamed protein product n=1 Tax=Phytophthora fragariaefolia TaxID=1490495 RepID=A0A9W6XMQ3_9STRA|nr:unnamed protein product [Phytophthora fragariaefolia]
MLSRTRDFGSHSRWNFVGPDRQSSFSATAWGERRSPNDYYYKWVPSGYRPAGTRLPFAVGCPSKMTRDSDLGRPRQRRERSLRLGDAEDGVQAADVVLLKDVVGEESCPRMDGIPRCPDERTRASGGRCAKTLVSCIGLWRGFPGWVPSNTSVLTQKEDLVSEVTMESIGENDEHFDDAHALGEAFPPDGGEGGGQGDQAADNPPPGPGQRQYWDQTGGEYIAVRPSPGVGWPPAMQPPVLSQVMGSTGPLVGYGDGAPAPTPTHSQYGAMVPPAPTTTMATITPPSTRIRTAIPSYQSYPFCGGGTTPPSYPSLYSTQIPVTALAPPSQYTLSTSPAQYAPTPPAATIPVPAPNARAPTGSQPLMAGAPPPPEGSPPTGGGGLPAQGLAPVPGVPTPGGPPLPNHAGYGPPQAPLPYGYGNTYGPALGQRPFGMPSTIKNAIRMIKPFYSDSASVDKARTFWNAFVRATEGLDDALRLSASLSASRARLVNNGECIRKSTHSRFCEPGSITSLFVRPLSR